MIKKELIIDGFDIEDMNNFSVKGHVKTIIEIDELSKEFMSHRFGSSTLKNMFWSQFNVDYCGG